MKKQPKKPRLAEAIYVRLADRDLADIDADLEQRRDLNPGVSRADIVRELVRSALDAKRATS